MNLWLAGPAATVGVGGTLELVTLSEFQSYINETSDPTVDAQQQVLLNSAHQTAYSEMGGRFILRPATSFDYVFSPVDAGDELFLPQYPIGAISTVERGYMSAANVWTSQGAVAVGDYYYDAPTGRVYGNWVTDLHSTRVVWTGGYLAAEVPADIKEAVMMHVGVKWQRARRSRWDVKTIQSASEGYSYTDSDLPEAAAAVYRRYSLGTVTVG